MCILIKWDKNIAALTKIYCKPKSTCSIALEDLFRGTETTLVFSQAVPSSVESSALAFVRVKIFLTEQAKHCLQRSVKSSA